jgi:hypothetical protein
MVRATIAVMDQPPSRSRFLLVQDPRSVSSGEGRPKVRRYSLARLALGAPASRSGGHIAGAPDR